MSATLYSSIGGGSEDAAHKSACVFDRQGKQTDTQADLQVRRVDRTQFEPPGTWISSSRLASSHPGVRSSKCLTTMTGDYSSSLHLQAYQWPPPSTRVCEAGRQETAKRCDIRDRLYTNTFCPTKPHHRLINALCPAKPQHALIKSALAHPPTRPFTVADPERHNMLRSCSRTGAWRHQMVKHSSADSGSHGYQAGVCAMTTAQKKDSVELPVNAEQAEEEVVAAGQEKWTVPEFWPFCPTTRPASHDQRQCLKGREGCLHSRLRQCIRYVTNRKRMKRKSELPVKSENVCSRMYVVTRAASPSSSPPIQMDPNDLYKAFMDTIARQTRHDSMAPHRRLDRHEIRKTDLRDIWLESTSHDIQGVHTQQPSVTTPLVNKY